MGDWTQKNERATRCTARQSLVHSREGYSGRTPGREKNHTINRHTRLNPTSPVPCAGIATTVSCPGFESEVYQSSPRAIHGEPHV